MAQCGPKSPRSPKRSRNVRLSGAMLAGFLTRSFLEGLWGSMLICRRVQFAIPTETKPQNGLQCFKLLRRGMMQCHSPGTFTWNSRSRSQELGNGFRVNQRNSNIILNATNSRIAGKYMTRNIYCQHASCPDLSHFKMGATIAHYIHRACPRWHTSWLTVT